MARRMGDASVTDLGSRARAPWNTVSETLARAVSGWRPWHYALILFLHAGFFDATHFGVEDWYFVFYPWADAVRISITRYHEFPWWNPWMIAGQPLFADPQVAILMPETLLVVMFGAILGLKLAIVLYVLVGYEGTRFLCRELFGRAPFLDAVAVIPILLPTLALHLNVGHIVFLDFYLFPWLLAMALTWWRSDGRALAFGVVIGLFLLSYIHYTIIIAFTIAGVIALVSLVRRAGSRDTWRRAALVVCAALAIGLTRIVLTLSVVSGFPRQVIHYPIVYSFADAVSSLIEPLQDRFTKVHISDLMVWETSSYVGLVALVLSYEGLRQGKRAYHFIYVAAGLCLLLAWNNRDPMFPSTWLRLVPPWDAMLVITRWNIFGAYFILLGTVWGLVSLHRQGRRGLAAVLALLVVADLAFHVSRGYDRAFVGEEIPPFVPGEDPPKTVSHHQENNWADIRKNLVTAGAECTLLGMLSHEPARLRLGQPGYRGEFYGNRPVTVESWTPNRVVLRGTPGDTVTLNVNPSNYWTMNGTRLFPTARAFEIREPFQVTVPAGGRMEFLPRPPRLGLLLALQALFAAVTGVLAWRWWAVKRRQRAFVPPA